MKEFLKALRPETLFGSVLGFMVASALAFLDFGRPGAALAAATLAGLVSLHLSLNLIFHAVNPGRSPVRSGSGEEEGGRGDTLHQWAVVGSALALFMTGLALGMWLAEQGRPLIFLWGFGGIAAALAYIFSPPRLRRLGPGQIAVLAGFGPLLTTGVYYALTGKTGLAPALIGLPQTILLVAVLWADPLLPRLWDLKKTGEGERSGPGPDRAAPTLWTHLGLLVLALAALVLLVFATGGGWLLLLGLAVAPLGLSAALELGKKGPAAGPAGRARAKTVLTCVGLSLLLSAGLVGERFLRI